MRSRWPILMLLCVLASLLVPGIASASTAAGAETRVWAFDLQNHARVGVGASLTLELRPGCELAYDELTSDSLLAARATTHLHHSWPKYLGGPKVQDLQRLPRSVHDAYHAGLDKILPRQRGTAYYGALGPAARQQMQRDLADYTQAFDAKFGTQLYQSMLRNGFPRP